MSIKQQMIKNAGTCGEWAVRVDNVILSVVTSHSGAVSYGVNGRLCAEGEFDEVLNGLLQGLANVGGKVDVHGQGEAGVQPARQAQTAHDELMDITGCGRRP